MKVPPLQGGPSGRNVAAHTRCPASGKERRQGQARRARRRAGTQERSPSLPHARGGAAGHKKRKGPEGPFRQTQQDAGYSSGGSSLSWAMVNTGPSTQT